MAMDLTSDRNSDITWHRAPCFQRSGGTIRLPSAPARSTSGAVAGWGTSFIHSRVSPPPSLPSPGCGCSWDRPVLGEERTVEQSSLWYLLRSSVFSRTPIPCRSRGRGSRAVRRAFKPTMRGDPIELEQMGSAAAPLAVHCFYAGGHLQRRGRV